MAEIRTYSKGTTSVQLEGIVSTFPDLSVYVPEGAEVHSLRQWFEKAPRSDLAGLRDVTRLELDWTIHASVKRAKPQS